MFLTWLAVKCFALKKRRVKAHKKEVFMYKGNIVFVKGNFINE